MKTCDETGTENIKNQSLLHQNVKADSEIMQASFTHRKHTFICLFVYFALALSLLIAVIFNTTVDHNGTSTRASMYNSTSSSDQYTECMLNLERHVLTQSQIDEWDLNVQTIPFAVKIYSNKYWIQGLALDDYRYQQLNYSCNGLPAELHWMDRKTKDIVLIECPSSIDPRTTSLKHFSSTNRTSNEIVQTYDMTSFEECERKDIAMFQERLLPSNSLPREEDSSALNEENDIKIGVSACFIEDRKKAMEWAAYHKALGVDHIWLYVNEDWDGARDLPQRDYITWIPWNFHVSGMMRKHMYHVFKFQVASMNDALWRAKRMNMDWIATIDIDEYITLYNGTNEVGDNTLKEYLEESKKLRNYRVTSIEMKSVPFGSNLEIENGAEEKDLVIDHIYRNNVGIDDSEFHDNLYLWHHKQFMRVEAVSSVNTHYVNEKRLVHHELASILRVNHYKKMKRKGIYRYSGDLIKDTLLRDSFRDAIANDIGLK